MSSESSYDPKGKPVVFGGASSDDLEAYQMAKQKSTIPMGISQTKDKIICIFDASITLNKREK